MNGHVYMLIPIIQFPYHIPRFSPSYIISPSTRSFYTSVAPTALRIYRLPCMYMQADIDCHILISGSNSSPDRTPVHSADPDLPSACPSVTSNPVYPKLNICSVFPCFRNGTTNLTVASLSPWCSSFFPNFQCNVVFCQIYFLNWPWKSVLFSTILIWILAWFFYALSERLLHPQPSTLFYPYNLWSS